LKKRVKISLSDGFFVPVIAAASNLPPLINHCPAVKAGLQVIFLS